MPGWERMVANVASTSSTTNPRDVTVVAALELTYPPRLVSVFVYDNVPLEYMMDC